MDKKNGMNYAPKGKSEPVCKKGEFVFSAVGLNHGHINGMTNGLLEAGGTLKYVYDIDSEKTKEYKEKYPEVTIVNSLEEILNDEETKLVIAAAIPNERADLGIKVMESGKDYFTDKTPFTTLEQIDRVRETIKKTKQKYMVYFSERLHVESAVYAEQLIEKGAIGKVVQVLGLGPHSLNKKNRPEWFFKKEQYGGILCDIGSHQIEQFLFFTGNENAKIAHSKIANYNNLDTPELDDFGDATLIGENGATGYFRVDWFSPTGLSVWGDGRTIILGTEGYIELRKYVDVAKEKIGNNVYLVNKDGEQYFNVDGKVGFPFFGSFMLDCINRTEKAMTQEHALKAGELCIIAQTNAMKIK